MDSATTVQFVFIDTVILAGQSDQIDGSQLTGAELPGPADVTAADDQWTWIEQVRLVCR